MSCAGEPVVSDQDAVCTEEAGGGAASICEVGECGMDKAAPGYLPFTLTLLISSVQGTLLMAQSVAVPLYFLLLGELCSAHVYLPL